MSRKFNRKNAIHISGSITPNLNGRVSSNPYNTLDLQDEDLTPVYKADLPKHREERFAKERERTDAIFKLEMEARAETARLEEEAREAEIRKREAELKKIEDEREKKRESDAVIFAEYLKYLEFSSLSPVNIDRIKKLPTNDLSVKGKWRAMHNEPAPPSNQLWPARVAQLRKQLKLSIKVEHDKCCHSYRTSIYVGNDKMSQDAKAKAVADYRAKTKKEYSADTPGGAERRRYALIDHGADWNNATRDETGRVIPRKRSEAEAITLAIESRVATFEQCYKHSPGSCRVCSKIKQLEAKHNNGVDINYYRLPDTSLEWLINLLGKNPKNRYASDEYEDNIDYDGISYERIVPKKTLKRLAAKEAFYRALYMERCPLRFDEWYAHVKMDVPAVKIVEERNTYTNGRGYQAKMHHIQWPSKPMTAKPAAAGV